ncbi:hypothetical protein ACS0TY_035851 [Phlomoides rotata]
MQLLLPVIDFSELKQETPTWESVKTQVLEALQEYGCFEAKFDEIPRKSVSDAMKHLFDLPLDTKLRCTSDVPYQGYTPKHPLNPHFESLGIEDFYIPGKIDAFANLMWPQGNPTFSKTVESLAGQMNELGRTVRKMVLESLGLEKYEVEHMDSSFSFVRFLKYEGPGRDGSAIGLPSHTDDSIVTILYEVNDVRALQVQTKDGQLIAAEPSPNSFFVMAGDTFNALTNGRVHTPHHQVTITGDKDRYSVGVFSRPKPGCIVKVPEELVDEDHPLLFKPFDHGEFVKYYQSQLVRGFKVGLKDYCGV